MLKIENIQGKNVLLRADLDVPVKAGRVENSFRLESLLPTIKFCQNYAHRTLIIGHLGRPSEMSVDFSLVPVQKWLKEALNQDITLVPSGFSPGENWIGNSPLSLMENLRFDSREQSLDREFARELSAGAEIYVYEAFATYNSCTSLNLIPELIPTVTGIQFDREVSTLSNLLKAPVHPTLLIASGAKMDKLATIKQIASKFDKTLLGGKFASPEELTPDGLDLNSETTRKLISAISEAETIVLNGPLGYYEDGIHSEATKAIFSALKISPAFTILGGGDTLAAIPSLGFAYTDYGFISTGGGAMLDFINTGTHPLLEILKHVKV